MCSAVQLPLQHRLFLFNLFRIGLSHNIRADLHLLLNHTGHSNYSWTIQNTPYYEAVAWFFKIATCIIKKIGVVGCHVGAESFSFHDWFFQSTGMHSQHSPILHIATIHLQVGWGQNNNMNKKKSPNRIQTRLASMWSRIHGAKTYSNFR